MLPVLRGCALPRRCRPCSDRFGSANQPVSGPGNRLGRESRYVGPLGHTAGMTFTTRTLTPETWTTSPRSLKPTTACGVAAGAWDSTRRASVLDHTREGNREAKRRHVRDETERSARCSSTTVTAASAGASSARRRKSPISRTGAPTTEGLAIRRTGGSAASSPTPRTAAGASPPLRSRQRSRKSSGPAAASSRPIRSRPSSGRPQRGAYLHTGPEELYAQYGFTRVRKIANGRPVMRTKILIPAARRRSRKAMLP